MKLNRNLKILLIAINAIVISYLIAAILILPSVPKWYALLGVGICILVVVQGLLFKKSLSAGYVLCATLAGVFILHIPYLIITQCKYNVPLDVVWHQFISGSGFSYSLVGTVVGYFMLLIINREKLRS